MKPTKSNKPYWEMTVEELGEATREFEKPVPMSRRKPVSKAGRARFERALRTGSQIHRFDELGINPKLLSAASAYAKRKKIPFLRFVERSLRHELAGRK